MQYTYRYWIYMRYDAIYRYWIYMRYDAIYRYWTYIRTTSPLSPFTWTQCPSCATWLDRAVLTQDSFRFFTCHLIDMQSISAYCEEDWTRWRLELLPMFGGTDSNSSVIATDMQMGTSGMGLIYVSPLELP